jgi:hypothetical protein
MTEQKPEQKTETTRFSFLAQIPKVLYTPQKAFKEIVQNPKYAGPILIMILFAAAYTASAYTFVSKGYDEHTLPTLSTGDEWTENTTAIWTSNAMIAVQSADGMGVGYFGNSSIEFDASDSAVVWMQLNGVGPVNCSGPEGYKNVSLRLKPIYPDSAQLANASIYLLSSQTDYFYYNLTKNASPINNTSWNNFTIQLGTENGWENNDTNADWSSITGMRFEFTWSEALNSTIRLDGLFFRGVYKPALENVFSSSFNFSVFGLMQFVLRWVIVGVLLFVMTRGFGGTTLWKPILVAVGFALTTMFVHAIINVGIFSTLPTLYYPFELMAGIEGEYQTVVNQLSAQTWLSSEILRYVQLAVYVWTVGLCAVGAREASQSSWLKCALLATVAFFTSLIAESFILGI